MTCLHCKAETTNGLALCERCQIAVSVHLEFLPVHYRNLDRWRPGRAGSRSVPKSRPPTAPLPASSDRVMRALDEVGNDLVTWARMLNDDRGIELPEADSDAEQVAALCRWFAEHLTSIATLDWAGRFVADLGTSERRLGWLTSDVIPGWYAGRCRATYDGVACGALTYVIPGLTWVTCGGCGATTYARDHLEVVLNEARDWVADRKRMAGVLVALVDSELSVPKLADRIRKWDSWDWLEATRRRDADGDPVGPRLYRLGDVLDLVTGKAEAPTRPKRQSA